jgi:hypothetical protein
MMDLSDQNEINEDSATLQETPPEVISLQIIFNTQLFVIIQRYPFRV